MAAVASLWAWASITNWITPTTLFLFLNLVIGTIAVTSRFNSNNRQRHQQNHHDSHGQLVRAPSLLDRVKSIDFSLYKFPNHSQEQEQEQQAHLFQQHTEHEYHTNRVQTHQPQLGRAPSLLDRVKSINFYLYKFPNYTQEQELHFFQPNTEPAYDSNPDEPGQPQLARAPSFLERVKSINLSSVYRSQQQQTYPETETETEIIHNPETNPDHQPKRSKSEKTKKVKPRVQENMKKSVSEKSMMVEKEGEEEGRESVEQRSPQTAILETTVTIGDGDHGVDAKAADFINKFKRQLRLQRLDSLLRYKEMLQGR